MIKAEWTNADTLDLQPTCNQLAADYISRQAAIDAIRDAENHAFNSFYKGLIKAHKIIADLPPTQPEPRWIPVSERLPLLRGSYKISDDVLITNGYEIDMGYLVERKGKIFWHYYAGECEVGIKDKDNDATAWMPLPEPYNGESEDKE